MRNVSCKSISRICGFDCTHELHQKVKVGMQVQTENCALLVCYAASSGNFLLTFRDNRSVSYSGFKNQSAVLSYFAAQACNHAKCTRY
jgi:hypothetical protein